jgi:predicted Zn-dependent protease
VYRVAFAARRLTPAIDAAFRVAAETFRRTPSDEVREARPLRISVVKVARGDTVQRLAARMAVPEQKLEQFLILNGLTREAKLQPGDLVKVVSE